MTIERLNSQDDKDRAIEALETELTTARGLLRDQYSPTGSRWLANVSSLDLIGSSGIALLSLGVGCFDWKAGLIVAGILLIATCLYAARG